MFAARGRSPFFERRRCDMFAPPGVTPLGVAPPGLEERRAVVCSSYKHVAPIGAKQKNYKDYS
jgi:hypothetical protein